MHKVHDKIWNPFLKQQTQGQGFPTTVQINSPVTRPSHLECNFRNKVMYCILSILRAGKPTAAKTPTNPVSLFTSHKTHYSAWKTTYFFFSDGCTVYNPYATKTQVNNCGHTTLPFTSSFVTVNFLLEIINFDLFLQLTTGPAKMLSTGW